MKAYDGGREEEGKWRKSLPRLLFYHHIEGTCHCEIDTRKTYRPPHDVLRYTNFIFSGERKMVIEGAGRRNKFTADRRRRRPPPLHTEENLENLPR